MAVPREGDARDILGRSFSSDMGDGTVLCDNDIPVYSISHAHASSEQPRHTNTPGMASPASVALSRLASGACGQIEAPCGRFGAGIQLHCAGHPFESNSC
eukprot:6204792-Pleurochrysis_carterae.AAC.3